MRILIFIFSVAAGVPTVAVAQQAKENWAVDKVKDDFTAQTTFMAVSESHNTKIQPHRRNADVSGLAVLAALCEKGKYRVYVQMRGKLIAGHRPVIQYKFDDKEPKSGGGLAPAQSSEAIGIWNDASARNFMSAIEKHERLSFRIEDSVFGQTDISFSISGAKPSFDKIRSECKK